jgi:ABC-type multidrug transport system fused ATPase/permease subunit
MMILCHVVLAACAIFFVFVCKQLVDCAVAAFSGSGDLVTISKWFMFLLGIVLMRIAINAIKSYIQAKTEARLKNSLRRNLFDIMLRMQSDGSHRHHSGDIISRIQEDVRVVSSAFVSSIPNFIGTCLQFSAATAFLIWLDFRLALAVVVILPVGLGLGKFITSRIKKLTLDIRESDSKVQSHVQESIQHLTLLQSMEYAGTSSTELDGLQDTLYNGEIRRTRFSVISRIFISLAFQTGYIVAFMWGVLGISHGTVTYGMMTAFLQLVGQIQRPLLEMSTQIPSIIHSAASVERIMEIEALPQEPEVAPVVIKSPAGIRLSDVTFAYPGSSRKIFEKFSFDFTPGSRTSVVGPTGVGKSTLIRLLLALLKPDSGRICVYSADDSAAEVSPATRCNLVYVPQGNSLFSGTVRDNLLMGNPDATEQQMTHALHTAAADFVFDLKNGLDTHCSEGGAGLSEGQAQRIAIARALLRPGSILLLDEFSSALDAETENELMDRLTRSLPDHTMIFITHRERIIDYCTATLRLGEVIN